jgi:hypothetical protein
MEIALHDLVDLRDATLGRATHRRQQVHHVALRYPIQHMLAGAAGNPKPRPAPSPARSAGAGCPASRPRQSASRRANLAFGIDDEGAFVQTMMADLPPPPPQAAALRAANAGRTA